VRNISAGTKSASTAPTSTRGASAPPDAPSDAGALSRPRQSRTSKTRGRSTQRRWLSYIAATFAALIALAAGLTPVSAQDDAVRIVSAALSPATATVGDRITLTVVVDHDQAITIEPPGFGADYGGLELVDIADPRDEQRDGRTVRTTLAWTLVPFHIGDITLPPLTVIGRGPAGTSVARTPARTLSVRSVLQPGETELRPLKPQLDIAEPAPSPVVPVLFVGAFAALTAFGYLLHRRAVAVRPAAVRVQPEPAPAETPAMRARAALDAIGAGGLAERDVPEYYARVAAVVRAYLSERFDFAAYAMTRRELQRAMEAHGIDRWPARVAANLLEQCDAAEFAGFVPAPERRAADLDAAYEIIRVTAAGPA